MRMKETLFAPVRYVVYVNGNFHTEVLAYDRDEALEIAYDQGVGCYIEQMDAELYVDDDAEPVEDGYPLSLYGN
jgi:hypothetical protein